MVTEPTETAAPAGRRGLGAGAAGIYTLAVVLLGLGYFGAVLMAMGGAPFRALRSTAVVLVPGVLLGILAVRLGRRVRWFEGRRARLAILHAALAIGYTTLWNASVLAIFAAEQWLLPPPSPASFKIRFESLGFGLFTGLLLYGCVAGAAFGLETSARLRDERARAARAETLRVRAELAALRAQLNPHFLFNTLHTVLGLVRRDPTLAEEALQDLGDVLRYSLDVQREQEHVDLRHELQFVQRYLAIERIRLGERLRVEEDVSEAALACRLPAFTLQPIVENAVRYAVASRAQGGRVRIEARRAGGDGPLRLVVSDDGAADPPAAGGAGLAVTDERRLGPCRRQGASEASREDAQQIGGQTTEAHESSGLGLTLVRQRLDAAFGAEARLLAERTPAGFVVTLDIPQTGERAT